MPRRTANTIPTIWPPDNPPLEGDDVGFGCSPETYFVFSSLISLEKTFEGGCSSD